MANARNVLAAPAADFAETNPWLGDGEERIETDTRKSKTGPGYWNDLDYGAGQTGGSGASGLTLVDLGWVHAADLLGGVQEVYTPTLHQFVQLTFGTDGYVASDGDMAFQVTFFADYDAALTFALFQAGANAGAVRTGMKAGWAVRFADPIPAFLATGTSGWFIFGRGAAWAPNHVYAAPAPVAGTATIHSIDTTSSVTESGHLWSSSGAGTSDGSKPDFAGNIGGAVVDNDITWTDEGAIPTVGSIHLYALVSP